MHFLHAFLKCILEIDFKMNLKCILEMHFFSKGSLYLYSFKRYQNFLLKIEILDFYIYSLQNRAQILQNHKIKYLGVLKYADSEKNIKRADNEY